MLKHIRYFASNHYAVVRGKPSASLAASLASDEKARIDLQVQQLGSEGLEKSRKRLAEAKAEHDRPIPQDIIASFKVPNVDSIAWIPVETTYNYPHLSAPANYSVDTCKEDTRLPFYVQFEDVKVGFIIVEIIKH